MKKMKRVAGNSYHQPLFHMVDDETGARFKQQRLLQEYLQVQKEFVSKKKKLQIAKQKREILLAEVRFLRHRYNLLKKQSSELETEKDLVGSLNSHSQSNLLAENRSFGGSEHVVKSSPPILNLNQSSDDEDCYRGRKEDIVLDTLRMEKQQKNWMINEKRVGKKKISWQDQAMAVHLLECVRIDECSGMNPSHMIAGIKLSQTETCAGLSSA